MDIIDGEAIVSVVASGTTNYLQEISPVLLLMGGLVLAVGMLFVFVWILKGRKDDDNGPF